MSIYMSDFHLYADFEFIFLFKKLRVEECVGIFLKIGNIIADFMVYSHVPLFNHGCPIKRTFGFNFLFKKLRVEDCVGALKKFSI